jgi:hypothetical protein
MDPSEEKIDRTYPDFVVDARNIRFSLSTDGMNPSSEMSSSHSTWPVTLCIYNLPPWGHEAKIHHDAGAYPGPKATW